jgi:uridine kinase
MYPYVKRLLCIRNLFLCVIFLSGTTLAGNLFAEDVLIVGIAGGSGSGKTTTAEMIQNSFGDQALILSQDSYYKDLSGLSLKEKEKTNFDHPNSVDFDLLEKHLLALKNGYSINRPTYDFRTHSRVKEENLIHPKKIIIVEGILLLAMKNIREVCDINVFVDADEHIRLFRRIERDMDERGRTFESVKTQYLATVHPMHFEFVEPSKHFADIIISGSSDIKETVSLLVSRIISKETSKS